MRLNIILLGILSRTFFLQALHTLIVRNPARPPIGGRPVLSGLSGEDYWMPAFAGMTAVGRGGDLLAAALGRGDINDVQATSS